MAAAMPALSASVILSENMPSGRRAASFLTASGSTRKSLRSVDIDDLLSDSWDIAVDDFNLPSTKSKAVIASLPPFGR